MNCGGGSRCDARDTRWKFINVKIIESMKNKQTEGRRTQQHIWIDM